MPLATLATGGTFSASHPEFAWIALAYASIALLLGGWLQIAARKNWQAWIALAPAIAIALATLLRIAATSGIDADESEHLHLAFAMGRDVMPYRDLDQNHAPLLWILSAPLLSLLPESPYVLLLFRMACLASFAGGLAIACKLSKTLLPGGTYQTPLCVVLGLAYATQAEVYRFRPDAFMNTLALASIYLLIRARPSLVRARAARTDRRNDLLVAGLCQGLAVAFSPKVGHLVLAVPVLLWLRGTSDQGVRDRLSAVFSSMFIYAAGVAVVLLGVLMWVAWHGLLPAAYEGIVSRNLGYALRRVAAPAPQQPGFYNSVLELGRLAEMACFFAVAIAGSWMAMTARAASPGVAALGIRRCMVGIWLLWLALWTFTPNAASYHIAGALLLGSALGAPALEALVVRWGRVVGWPGAARRLALGLLIALCLGTAPLRSGIGGFVTGYSYPLSRVAWLLDEVRLRGDACLCIVPWHPIFVASVAPVYRSNEMRSGRWPEAIDWSLANRPAAVMAPRFTGLVERGVVSEAQRLKMMEFLNTHYELVPAGPVGFWLLKTNR